MHETETTNNNARPDKPFEINFWLALAVLLGLLFCVVFTVYSGWNMLFGESAQVAAMKEVIRQDIELKQSLAEMNDQAWYELYVREADDADLVGCPEDFQQAYRSHITVWKELSDKSKDDQEMGFLKAMWTVATLSARDAVEFQEKYNRRAESTWREVERTAKSHGVPIPDVVHVPFTDLPELKKKLRIE